MIEEPGALLKADFVTERVFKRVGQLSSPAYCVLTGCPLLVTCEANCLLKPVPEGFNSLEV
jgi:hypothetical protein